MVDEVMTELAPPTVESEPTDEQVGEIFELSFTVRATINKLKELKEFLTDGGYEVL